MGIRVVVCLFCCSAEFPLTEVDWNPEFFCCRDEAACTERMSGRRDVFVVLDLEDMEQLSLAL